MRWEANEKSDRGSGIKGEDAVGEFLHEEVQTQDVEDHSCNPVKGK
jgi:hypothetical protein